jgi:hypothetical protein
MCGIEFHVGPFTSGVWWPFRAKTKNDGFLDFSLRTSRTTLGVLIRSKESSSDTGLHCHLKKRK